MSIVFTRMGFYLQMVAVALLLGRNKDVRRGGWDPLPEEQLSPE